MPVVNKVNQNLMKLIKSVHSLVVSDDLDKNRQSQDSIGKLLGTKSKEATYTSLTVGQIPAELISVNRPHSKKGLILYCHGGGYITGSLHYARTLTTKLAVASSMDVLTFDYRLAPESPYPAALDDALSVWDALMHHGFGSRDIIVIGDSAGGNLALALGLKLKSQHRFLPRGIACMSPWSDLTLSGETHQTQAEFDPILDKEYMERARHAYTTEENFNNPFVSPLFGDYTGFPPIYLQAGSNEILLSDSVRLYHNLQSQHVMTKFDEFNGMWHVFQMSNFPVANDAIDKIASFIFKL